MRKTITPKQLKTTLSRRMARAEEKRIELTRRITQSEEKRLEAKWRNVISQLENIIKDQAADLQKRVKVDETKTPFCAALGHLYEKRNMVDSAIKLIEPIRNIYLLEQGKSL